MNHVLSKCPEQVMEKITDAQEFLSKVSDELNEIVEENGESATSPTVMVSVQGRWAWVRAVTRLSEQNLVLIELED